MPEAAILSGIFTAGLPPAARQGYVLWPSQRTILNLFGYVEIATRLPHSESEDPDAILVFEDDQVFWDIVNPKAFAQLTESVERLTYPTAKHTKTRSLTEEDWVMRIQAMQSAELF